MERIHHTPHLLSLQSKQSSLKSGTALSSESGSVFFAIMGAVAVVAILAVSVSTFMKGPLSTAVKLTKLNSAESSMQIAAQVAVMGTASQANNGDCDHDGLVEPMEWRAATSEPIPIGGGLIPLALGTSKKDPWGTEYGYCVWDHYVTDTCAAADGSSNPAKRLHGAPTSLEAQSLPVIAIISAGPDKVFTTTCRSFTAADTNSNGVLTDSVDLPLVSKALSTDDDIIMQQTYTEALAASGGLWQLKATDPAVATISKNVEVTGRGSFSQGVILPSSSLLTCDAGSAGVMAKNSAGTGLQICDGTNWITFGGGTIDDLSDAITNYTGTGSTGKQSTSSMFFGEGVGATAIAGANSNVGIGTSSMKSLTSGAGNVAVGTSALQDVTTGTYNVGLGLQALQSQTTGDSNIGIGVQTLRATTTGSQNIGIGKQVMSSNITGGGNIAFGFQPLIANTSGNYNTAIGFMTLYGNTTGTNNFAVGFQTMYVNKIGSYNIAIGDAALKGNNAANKNVAIGYQSQLNTNNYVTTSTDTLNTSVGNQALYGSGGNNTGNTAIGAGSMYSTSTGSYSVAVGQDAGRSTTTGASNVAVGYQANYSTLGGSNNVSVGYQAGYANAADYNTAIGSGAMYSLKRGTNVTAIGYQALYYVNDTSTVTSLDNVAIGARALRGSSTAANNTGISNIAIGSQSLLSNTSGNANISIGSATMGANTTGSYNTSTGSQALGQNSTGAANTAIGYQSLYTTTAGFNTAIGYLAGYGGAANTTPNTTGTYNTFVGNMAVASLNNPTNSTALGNGSVITASNTIVLGNTAITQIRAQVTSITAISDKRKKKDIEESELGLSFINSLRPVQYRYNNGDDTLRFGFIAQETESVLPKDMKPLVGKEAGLALVNHDADKDQTYHMAYGELTAPMVKAVQEQQTMINNLIKITASLGAILAALLTYIIMDRIKSRTAAK